MTIPTCHPDRKHKAKGLCASCYGIVRRGQKLGTRPRGHMADCHPNRKHYGHGLCRGCYHVQWNRNHPEGHRRDAVRYREAHPERASVAIKAAKEKKPEKYKVIINAKAAFRRAVERQACPVWADREKIKSIYEEAAKMKQETGLPYEVDHIYPLISSYVCGLHVPENLQIILGSENRSKGNRLVA